MRNASRIATSQPEGFHFNSFVSMEPKFFNTKTALKAFPPDVSIQKMNSDDKLRTWCAGYLSAEQHCNATASPPTTPNASTRSHARYTRDEPVHSATPSRTIQDTTCGVEREDINNTLCIIRRRSCCSAVERAEVYVEHDEIAVTLRPRA